MLKIVPDPPHSNDSPYFLEDTLTQACEYVVCALAVVHQSVLLSPPCSAEAALNLTVMHELRSARALLETALSRMQMQNDGDGQTRH